MRAPESYAKFTKICSTKIPHSSGASETLCLSWKQKNLQSRKISELRRKSLERISLEPKLTKGYQTTHSRRAIWKRFQLVVRECHRSQILQLSNHRGKLFQIVVVQPELLERRQLAYAHRKRLEIVVVEIKLLKRQTAPERGRE